jgi:RNA polymerase sigma-70 factor (ECF subfamily)
MDDSALVAALRQGDPDAPRLLVERYQGLVFALCLRMLRHRQDAEDVVQETFLRALRSVGGFDPTRCLRPWLLGIAANRCRTAMGRRVRRPSSSDLVLERVDPHAGVPDPDDVAGLVERALGQVRAEYRAVFVLYHEQEMPYEEIAEALGRPVGTIKTWLHRARAELAGILAGWGVDERPTR